MSAGPVLAWVLHSIPTIRHHATNQNVASTKAAPCSPWPVQLGPACPPEHMTTESESRAHITVADLSKENRLTVAAQRRMYTLSY